MLPTKSTTSIESTSPSKEGVEKVPGTPSPKRKKIYTVARSIPSTPTLDLSGANDTFLPISKTSTSKDEVKFVLNKNLRRDNNGKIFAHAALGTQEDIDQFDDYLLSVPSATSGMKSSRGKNLSSRMIKKAANRLTRSLTTRTTVGNTSPVKSPRQIPSTPNTSSKENSKTDQGLHDIASIHAAAKARQQMIAYKKMLRAIPIHKRIAMEREKKVLKIWETRNREWEQFRTKMSRKLNKPAEDLVMVKASDYRQQMEEYDLISKATPQEEKHGNEYWSVSLRDEGTRFVPVGNVFSGLFCPIKEDRNPMTEIIRRPMDNFRHLSPKKGNHQSKFDEALLKRKRQLRRNIQQIRPHQVSDEQCDALKVESEELFEWASTSSQRHYDDLLQIERDHETESDERVNSQSISENVIDHTKKTIELAENSPQIDHEGIVGPCMELSLTQIENAPPIMQECHLTFHTKIEKVQTKNIFIRNPGTMTIQFSWSQYGPSHRDFAVEAAGLEPRTFVSVETGVLLPSETKRISFSFYSKNPGTFLERWKIIIDPYHAENIHLPLYAPERSISMTCSTVDYRAPYQARRRIMKTVEFNACGHMMRNLVEEIITGLTLPQPVETNKVEEHKRQRFERINCHLHVHYVEEVYQSMTVLYERAQNLILADKQAKLIQTGGQDNSQSESALSTSFSTELPTWDGCLSTLALVAKEADDISRVNFKAVTPRKDASDDENEGDDGEDEVEDDEDDDSSAITKSKKEIFKPLFQLMYQELRHVALFRPHDPSILATEIYRCLSFLCSEIPVVDGISQLNESNDIHTDLYQHTSQFIQSAVDTSVTTLFEKENVLAIQHFRRKQIWIQDKLAYDQYLFQSNTSIQSTNILVHVDLDVSNCFVASPRDDEVVAEKQQPPSQVSGSPPVSPVPIQCEWKWMDGIDSFTPTKIAHVAQFLTKLTEEFHAQFDNVACDTKTSCVVNVVLVSSMSPPPPNRAKSKKKSVEFNPPDSKVPSMEFVAEKLRQVVEKNVKFVGTIDMIKELHAPASPLTPQVVEQSEELPTQPSTDELPKLEINFYLVESFELLRNPPIVKVDQPPVDEKVKDDKKDKPGKKTPAQAKKEEEIKPPPTERTPIITYETLEAKWSAVWEGTYTDQIAESLRGWPDVFIADTFGGDEWPTLQAIPTTRDIRLMGPKLVHDCQRVGRMMQPHDELVLRHHPNGKLVVLLGGESFSSKVWLFDGLLEVADEIYLCGAVAAVCWRYFHLAKECQKSCGGEHGFELDVEPGMSYQVIETLRRKAARYLVKIYLPFDWHVGDTPFENEEKPMDDDTPPNDEGNDGENEDEEEEEENDDEDDEEEEEDKVKSKKSKKKVVIAPPVIVVEPPNLPHSTHMKSYDGIVMHLLDTSTDEPSWQCIDDILPGSLSRFHCQTKSPTDGVTLPTPPIHTWIKHAYEIGPLSIKSLLDHFNAFNRIVIAGLPGCVEYMEFQSSTRLVASYIESKQDKDILLVGQRTHAWIRQFSSDIVASDMASHELNASVMKYIVAGQIHPAITSLSSHVV